MIEVPLILGRLQSRWLQATPPARVHFTRFNYVAQLDVLKERRIGWQLIFFRWCLSFYTVHPL